MVPIASLWLPILVSAVLVWIASALVWTVMPHRKKEFAKLSNEDDVRAAINAGGAASGQYAIPHAQDQAAMKDPDVQRRFQEGPVGLLTLRAPGHPAMGKPMVLSFVFYLLVGWAVAYLVTRTVDPGAGYLEVFRVAGTTAFYAYGLAIVPESIWFGRPWSSTVKTILEALAYGLLTAGAFGWAWPG